MENLRARIQDLQAAISRTASIWEAIDEDPNRPTSDGVRSSIGPGELPADFERAVTAIALRPRRDDESHREYGMRREHELLALFESLMPAQSLACSRRMAAARPDDPIVTALARLTHERRSRLVRHLSDCRRQRTRPPGCATLEETIPVSAQPS